MTSKTSKTSAALGLDGETAADADAQTALAAAQNETLARLAAEAPAAELKVGQKSLTGPTRATWKHHGNPQTFAFYGRGAKPAETSADVASVESDPQGLTLKSAGGATVERFGIATKFWALPIGETDEQRAERHQRRDVRAADDAARDAAEQALTGKRPRRPRTDQRAPKPGVTNTVPADAAPRAARVPAVRVARREIPDGHGDAPAGYLPIKITPGYDQFRKADATADGPEWLTRCNEHGKTTPAKDRKHGRSLGTAAARPGWCAGCKRAAAKLAAAADATAEHDAAAK